MIFVLLILFLVAVVSLYICKPSRTVDLLVLAPGVIFAIGLITGIVGSSLFGSSLFSTNGNKVGWFNFLDPFGTLPCDVSLYAVLYLVEILLLFVYQTKKCPIFSLIVPAFSLGVACEQAIQMISEISMYENGLLTNGNVLTVIFGFIGLNIPTIFYICIYVFGKKSNCEPMS